MLVAGEKPLALLQPALQHAQVGEADEGSRPERPVAGVVEARRGGELVCGLAGLRVTAVGTRTGTVRLASIEDLVRIEADSTPLRARISEKVYGRILRDSLEALGRFRTDTGVEVPIKGHIVTAVHADAGQG
ncbi:hypothetical protein ACFSKW_26730 [Nonomuraea mangrovi]|uniref:Uncharacterized protein n=1 Tax=Nonomuraea mangrovi TaxID=2316207 RepID=A0ABW4SZI4_9ACTN